MKRLAIVSGGQAGVERAALDVGLELYIPLRGWCPKGRVLEDGPLHHEYPVQETPTSRAEQRLEWNVRDSDGTLVLVNGDADSSLTERCCYRFSKPLLELELEDEPDAEAFQAWLSENEIDTLHISGPRESHRPGYVYRRSLEFLKDLLGSQTRGGGNVVNLFEE